MPKPFLYYVDFIDNPLTNDQRLQNAESIRGMLLGNGPEMTIYALSAVVSAAYIASEISPTRITNNWYYYYDGERYIFRDTYGLWQVNGYTEGETEIITAIDQCDNLILTLKGLLPGYVPRDDGRTSLQEFLASGYNVNLGLIFVKNYVCADLLPPYFENEEWMDSCRENYNQLLQYFQTHPPKISPVAIAVFAKKKKRRWWK